MKKWLSVLKLGESGQAMLAVLALMVLGGFLVIPALNFASTSLKTTNMFEKKLDGLYAADAGVEDALWRIQNDTPTSLPYSYQLTNINGMTVDVVIKKVTTIAGEKVGESGGHEDYLQITKIITYDDENSLYSYTSNITNSGEGNIKVCMILIAFPPGLQYSSGSTGGYFTSSDPTVNGNSTTGITLIWNIPNPYPTISVGDTKSHTFLLSGPPGVVGVEGHGFVEATRDDVGTIWDAESHPYSVTAQAKDGTGTVIATIRAGVWGGIDPDISCWQVNP